MLHVNTDELAAREAPYAWANLMNMLTAAGVRAHVQPHGRNKMRIGLEKPEDFLSFMDKVFSNLKEKGFSFKYKKTSAWVAEDDDLDSNCSTSTTFSDRTIFLCDTQPWYTPDEIQERIEAILG